MIERFNNPLVCIYVPVLLVFGSTSSSAECFRFVPTYIGPYIDSFSLENKKILTSDKNVISFCAGLVLQKTYLSDKDYIKLLATEGSQWHASHSRHQGTTN